MSATTAGPASIWSALPWPSRRSLYCFIWAILLEYIALSYQIRMHPSMLSLGFLRMIFLWMIGVAGDGLIISAGVFLLSEGIIRRSLRKRVEA